MKHNKLKLGVIAALLVLSATAYSQLINGNTFSFWNVNGPLTVVGATSLTGVTTQTGALNVTGATTITGAVVGVTATDSTTSTTGAIITAGGLGVAKNLVIGAQLVVAATASPAAADACTAGRIVWDASYVYVCTATGVWKRSALTGSY